MPSWLTIAQQHPEFLAGFSTALIILGLIRLNRRGMRKSTNISADQRAVAMGGSNYGTIITGDIGSSGGSAKSSGPDWIGIASLIVGIIGDIIAFLAWLHPISPAP